MLSGVVGACCCVCLNYAFSLHFLKTKLLCCWPLLYMYGIAAALLQHLSLEEVVQLAREVGGKQHGFLAVQLPVNARMTEAFAQPWQQIINPAATDAARRAAEAAAAAAAAAEAALRLKEPEDVDPEKISAAMDRGVALPPPPPPSPPPPPPAVVYDNVTLLEAAKRLGVAVFASGPLMEVSCGFLHRMCVMVYHTTTLAGQHIKAMAGLARGCACKQHILSWCCSAAGAKAPKDVAVFTKTGC